MVTSRILEGSGVGKEGSIVRKWYGLDDGFEMGVDITSPVTILNSPINSFCPLDIALV